MPDERRLKAAVIGSWRAGGMESLVKVMPKGAIPNTRYPIGFCTTVKFIAGRTPAEIERIIGFKQDTKLVHGAEVFVVNPLPKEHEFALRGYSQTPAGVSTSHKDYVAHPLYPPAEGAPQWDLCYYDQSHFIHILTLEPGFTLRYMSAGLPVPR